MTVTVDTARSREMYAHWMGALPTQGGVAPGRTEKKWLDEGGGPVDDEFTETVRERLWTDEGGGPEPEITRL